ncbi:MAG: ABC transporter permease [Rhodothalassiaceae bacterium]|nr:MAG: ABC transporter permease [Rhodothalassiaceae bacterium]
MVDPIPTRTRVDARARAIARDEGLRAYMLRVYNLMASGVLLTGIFAILGFRVEAIRDLLYHPVVTPAGIGYGLTGLGWIVTLAPLGIVLAMSFGRRMRPETAGTLFWIFSALMGLSLSSVFFVFTGVSIARTFFITAAAFGALSLYGYTTKRDLTGFGTFLFMGLIGIIIAALVNLFIRSTMMDFIISAVGVLVFAGLTAYDTQRLKDIYYEIADDGTAIRRAAIMGALALYLDFINLFLMLLRFIGDRR